MNPVNPPVYPDAERDLAKVCRGLDFEALKLDFVCTDALLFPFFWKAAMRELMPPPPTARPMDLPAEAEAEVVVEGALPPARVMAA